MRKKKFLVFLIMVLGLTMSACKLDASTPQPTSQSDNDRLSDIFTAVASQTPPTQPGGIITTEQPQGGGVDPLADEAFDQGTQIPTVPAIVTATSTQQPTPAPTQALVAPTTYSLEKGEYPYCIARRFNIDVATLLNANNLSMDGLFKEGLTLTIPQNAPAFKGERARQNHPTDYTVRSGDTFYSIACTFGDVYPEEIASANGMTLNDNLTPGTVLHIP
jgi:LysM repeat protein